MFFAVANLYVFGFVAASLPRFRTISNGSSTAVQLAILSYLSHALDHQTEVSLGGLHLWILGARRDEPFAVVANTAQRSTTVRTRHLAAASGEVL